MRRLWLILLLAPFLALPGASPMPATTPVAGPAPLPSAAEVRKQIDDGQYREALKNLLRILDLKGTPAAAYDRLEMLLLRAECQLQIRQTPAAQAALDTVVKEARGGNNAPANPDALGKALALSALIARSPNMLYAPKSRTGPLTPKTIDILDRAARPSACKALFEDSLADVKARVRAAQGVNTLPLILDAAKAVATLRALEQAGTGDDAQSKPLVGELALAATVLLGNSVAEMNGAIDTIAAGANLVGTLPIMRVDPVSGLRTLDQVARRRGLVGDEPARLKSIQQTCAQIITTCQDLRVALNVTDPFQGIASDADTVARKAGKVLTDDYSHP